MRHTLRVFGFALCVIVGAYLAILILPQGQGAFDGLKVAAESAEAVKAPASSERQVRVYVPALDPPSFVVSESEAIRNQYQIVEVIETVDYSARSYVFMALDAIGGVFWGLLQVALLIMLIPLALKLGGN